MTAIKNLTAAPPDAPKNPVARERLVMYIGPKLMTKGLEARLRDQNHMAQSDGFDAMIATAVEAAEALQQYREELERANALLDQISNIKPMMFTRTNEQALRSIWAVLAKRDTAIEWAGVDIPMNGKL